MPTIANVSLLVPSYDEGITFYVGKLGFELVTDTDLGGGVRWVLVRPKGGNGTALLLAEPGNERQAARIGDQTGGRVGFFLFTDDFARDHESMSEQGVVFLEAPRTESYGTVAVFMDPFGNKWDLLQPAA
ncbi:VOC family protein [Hoeflea poritis]|uniref:VOC family protein n=1 Tax=Hoeflea poritis TaxID=2993659 RepID=A0ABT4VNM3_9HYPH|nr:VOC family protein [Hoeflea poritis]MDA4846313.1 VOC family protein [Hoeflea poritis]